MEIKDAIHIVDVLSCIDNFVNKKVTISAALVASTDIRLVPNPREKAIGIVLLGLDPMDILSGNVPIRVGGEYLWEEFCIITGKLSMHEENQPCLVEITSAKVITDSEIINIITADS